MNEKLHDKMPSHNIDDLFRSAIEPFEESPSADVWENVEKNLDRNNIINIKRKYNNFKKIAVAMVVILSSALVYEFQTQHGLLKSEHTDNATVKSDLSANNIIKSKGNGKENSNSLVGSNLPQSSGRSSNAVNADDAPDVNKPAVTLPDYPDLKKSFVQSFKTGIDKRFEPPVITQSYPKVNRNSNGSSEETIANNNATAIRINKNAEQPLLSAVPSAIDLLSGNTHNNLYSSAANRLKYHQPSNDHHLSDLAQQSIKLSDKRSYFSLSLIFSPDFTSRFIKEDWPINREDRLDEIRKSERYAFSYSLGALVDYRYTRHWEIQSGFMLSRAVINIDPKFIFARPDDLGDVKYKFNSSSGYSYLSPHSMSRPAFGDSLHAFSSISSLMYLSVPLSFKYNIARKKFNFYASAGAAVNILVKDKIKTSLGNSGNREDAVNHDIRGLKPVYYSALLAAGVSYNINKTVALSFTPTTRLALTSINKDAPVKSYQQSLGLVAGVQIGL